ncbi:MAG: hypothetical protein AAGG06_03660 [Pseudomonadota bacterium]
MKDGKSHPFGTGSGGFSEEDLDRILTSLAFAEAGQRPEPNEGLIGRVLADAGEISTAFAAERSGSVAAAAAPEAPATGPGWTIGRIVALCSSGWSGGAVAMGLCLCVGLAVGLGTELPALENSLAVMEPEAEDYAVAFLADADEPF